ncbi:MAG: stage II sporulation protein M, partial [Anaerolineae bacterium]|nr:stage II sporulation protein M [Anaerolineae bacterium]
AIMNSTAERAVNFVGRFGADIIGERLIPFLLMIVGFFPISVSLVIALESFVGEKERGSIEPLLTSPLSDWQLYLGKLIAVMVPPLLASYLGIAVYMVGVYRDIGWFPETELLFQILILTFVQALVMVSGAVVISTQTTSVRAANLLASFIIIPMAFLIQGESMVMFWAQYETLWWAVIGLVVIAGLLVRTGVGHFNREELLGRELDSLNFRWGWNTYFSAFKGDATSVGSWYRSQIRGLFKPLRMPLVLLVFILGASLLIGAGQADDFPIPPELINFDIGRGTLGEGFENYALFNTAGIPLIWFHNIRVILLATFLGLFTYGVLGVLIPMLPIMLIGYFMAIVSAVGISPVKLFVGFILPHGIFEIPALLFASAAILRMGANLAAPANGRTIGEGLLYSLADWTKVFIGIVVPLLFAAAAVEVLITPKIAIWLFGS